MPEDLKQNSEKKSSGVDLELLHKSAESLKSVQALPIQKGNKSMFSAAFMLTTAIEFAVLLAAPLIAAVFLGRWLTAKYHSPIYSIIALLAALAFSITAITLDIKKLSKKVKNL